jgi:hypothetical protein
MLVESCPFNILLGSLPYIHGFIAARKRRESWREILKYLLNKHMCSRLRIFPIRYVALRQIGGKWEVGAQMMSLKVCVSALGIFENYDCTCLAHVTVN